MEAHEKLEMLLEYSEMKILPFSKKVGQGSQTFYDIRSGKIQSFTNDVANKIVAAYPEINKEWLIGNDANMLKKRASPFDEPYTPEPKTDKKAEALKQLDKIKSQNGNGSENEGNIVDEDEQVPVPTYIIPIKGFANLRKHMFSDDYIDRNFEKTITYVPKSDRVPRLLKIQSTGKSMIPKIEENDYVYCEPIPDIDWLNYKFRADKMYCFFHFIKGILFKRAENIGYGEIRLTSDNPDKIEYPDITISIGEFKNILVIRKIEKIV